MGGCVGWWVEEAKQTSNLLFHHPFASLSQCWPSRVISGHLFIHDHVAPQHVYQKRVVCLQKDLIRVIYSFMYNYDSMTDFNHHVHRTTLNKIQSFITQIRSVYDLLTLHMSPQVAIQA